MESKLLYNTRTQIKLSKLISSNKVKITTLTRKNGINKFQGKINIKNYLLLSSDNKLGREVNNLCSFTGMIKPLTVNSLLRSRTVINLKFCIDKQRYNEYSSVIFDNLDDLYSRVVRLYNLTKAHLIEKGLSYVKDTYEITEPVFKKIINCLEWNGYKDYSEITDKVIVYEIIKHFRSTI